MKKKDYKKKLANERRVEKTIDFTNKDDSMMIIKIFIGVLLFIALMFVVTKFIVGDWSLSKKKDDKDVDYNNTLKLCGTLYNVDESEPYYVLMYEFGDEKEAGYYEVLEYKYQNKFSKAIYHVNLSDSLNNKCYGEIANITDDLSNLVVSGPTLLKIQNGDILESILGETDISNYISNLIK